MHAIPRQNLINLDKTTRASLRRKIIAYTKSVSDPVGMHEKHFPTAHGGVRFILWHRNFLKGFDAWQRNDCLEEESEFIPLAFWYPGDPIPSEFAFEGRNVEISPRILPQSLATKNGLENLTDVEAFANELESTYHDGIHGEIGGVMLGGRSPEDPIFWPMHAFFDHISANWESLHGDIVDGAGGMV